MRLSPGRFFSHTSLRRTLLYYLLMVLLPTLLLGSALAYFVAVYRVRDVADMNLLDIGRDLAGSIELRDDKLVLELPPSAENILRTANQDRTSYAVWNAQQGLISGDADLFELTRNSATGRGHQFSTESFRDHHQRIAQIHTSYAHHPLHIAVAQTTDALTGIQRSIFASVFLLGTLLTGVALGGVYLGVRRGLSPITTLSAAIDSRSPANLAALPVSEAPVELRPIVDNINSLLARLEQSLLAHRHFIADAAHQLRTPLATLNAQLEVALKIPPHDIGATLAQMHATTQRATHLARQLLSLARLEHIEQIPQTAEIIALEEILSTVLPRNVIAAETAGVELEFAIEPCKVIGNRILLEELFSNLFDNAIKYVQRGGQVRLQGRQQHGRAQLALIDNGPGVSAENLEKLGTAFFRADTSNQTGCGLGLAIAREIVRLHKGMMRFSRASETGGLRIDMEFPAA